MLDKLKESRDKLAGIKTTAQETLKSIGETEQLKADLTLTVSSVDKALAPLEAEIKKREAAATAAEEKAAKESEATANAGTPAV